jgi:hypothetical protein
MLILMLEGGSFRIGRKFRLVFSARTIIRPISSPTEGRGLVFHRHRVEPIQSLDINKQFPFAVVSQFVVCAVLYSTVALEYLAWELGLGQSYRYNTPVAGETMRILAVNKKYDWGDFR